MSIFDHCFLQVCLTAFPSMAIVEAGCVFFVKPDEWCEKGHVHKTKILSK